MMWVLNETSVYECVRSAEEGTGCVKGGKMQNE